MSTGAEVVRRAHDALNTGDVEALVGLCDKRFRLDMSDRVLNPAIYEGHDGIRRFYAEVKEVWETFSWEPIELRESGDVVVTVIHSKGRGRGSGLELDRRSAMVWRIDSGIPVSLTFYRDPDDAFAATGV